MPIEFSDTKLEQLEKIGYIIIPEYYTGKKLKEMQVAQRNILPTWDQVKNDPPTNRSILTEFPPSEISLLRSIIDHQAWNFGRKWLKTEQIHFRAGCMIARYPGFKGGGIGSDTAELHLDNGNNSLLPMSETHREFGQLVFWVHLEAVDADQAPLRLLSKANAHDMSKCEPLVCPAALPGVSLWVEQIIIGKDFDIILIKVSIRFFQNLSARCRLRNERSFVFRQPGTPTIRLRH